MRARHAVCSRCGATNLGEQAWCLRCHASLPTPASAESGPRCPRCGAPTRPGVRFCGQCGAPQVQPSAVRWTLAVRTGPQAGQAFAIGERTQVGRSTENDICLQGTQLSRHHALFERTPAGLRLTDLGSTNGTWVNGQRIAGPMLLHGGDSIALGDAQCTLRADA